MQAVAALCNLTSQVAENKRAICESGGLELAVQALKALPDNAELQQQGCGLLHNLACEKSLKPQVVAAGGLLVAEVAARHPQRAVQSVGHMLSRLLQDEVKFDTGKMSTGKLDTNGESPDKDKVAGDGDVDDLFAPRRGAGTRPPAGSKTLTRPQRKVMADVMQSMKQDPGELSDSLRGSSVKLGTIQRRLSWPPRKDDMHKSRSVNIL